MKKLLLITLISVSAFAQKQVYNVQQYCIDEKPFRQGQCDQLGNEYSFVFLDVAKGEVSFFLTNLKFEYKIIESKIDAFHTVYTLKNGSSVAEMKVNNAKTNIEFIYPDRRISLRVGKSTKLGH